MKMKSLYKAAIAQADQEEEAIRQALQKIAEIRNIKNERRIQVGLDTVSNLRAQAHLSFRCIEPNFSFQIFFVTIGCSKSHK